MAGLRSQVLEKARTETIKKGSRVSLGKIRVSNNSGWEGEISLAFGVNAIYGSNAAGKSSLLQGMLRALSESAVVITPGSSSTSNQFLFSGGSGAERIPSCAFLPEAKNSSSLEDGDVVYLDAMSRSERLLSDFAGDPNWEDFLEGVDPYEFTDKEIEVASYLLGGDYDAVSVYETSEEESDGRPFFRASKDGIEYNLFNMGRGELSSLYLVWAVVRRFAESKLFVMEEPEANLSVESQQRLLKLMYHFCQEYKSSFIISTHSPALIRQVPEPQTHRVFRFPNLEIRRNVSGSEAYAFLGGTPEIKAVGVLEDVLAVKFIEELVWYLDSSIGHQIVFIKGSSVSQALDLRQRLANGLLRDQRFSHRLRCFTILDGDQRTERLSAEQRMSNMYLPGSKAPEVELLHVARGIARSGEGKNLLDTHLNMITEGVQDGLGLNAHNAFEKLADRMGGFAMAVHHLLPSFLEVGTYGEQSQILLAKIREFCID